MKTLLSGQLKANQQADLECIIDYVEGIATLTRQMKRDDRYINQQYLQILADDAGAIKSIVNHIAIRSHYKVDLT